MAEILDKLKRRLRIEDTEQDALLGDLITDAAAFMQGYTGRASLPEAANVVPRGARGDQLRALGDGRPDRRTPRAAFRSVWTGCPRCLKRSWTRCA